MRQFSLLEALSHCCTTVDARVIQVQRILMWLMLIALGALVSYVGFRGYLSPELLINFANSFYC